MKFSRALKLSLALLVPLTLTISWKLASRPNDQIDVPDKVAVFLAEHKFSVAVTADLINATQVIRASSGSCRLLVARMLPLQDSIVQIQNLAATTDQVFIVFRGTVYDKQPLLLTVSNYLWFRFLIAVGFASHIPPVIAVVSSCNRPSLPWSELRW